MPKITFSFTRTVTFNLFLCHGTLAAYLNLTGYFPQLKVQTELPETFFHPKFLLFIYPGAGSQDSQNISAGFGQKKDQ